jgi:hypothetical protein
VRVCWLVSSVGLLNAARLAQDTRHDRLRRPTCCAVLCHAVPQVDAVMLDDVMQQPQAPEVGMMVQYETKSLR